MELLQIDDYRWEIKKTGAMNVPARIYSSTALIEAVKQEEAFKQLVNVAQLPGIVDAALAMPDVHWGYGFPIGGVAAFDCDDGIISPGGVGYDINCGVRLSATKLTRKDVEGRLETLAVAMQKQIPSGVGQKGAIRLTNSELKKVMKKGSQWGINQGYGDASDGTRIEDGGCMANADPDAVSQRAMERGRPQLGTLGSGNHFIEIGLVENVFDPVAADAFGIAEGFVTVMLHTGSRGLGHQVCDDFLASMTRRQPKGIHLPDRQLACAMFRSPEGEQYFNAMACAANFAWANRQVLMHMAMDVFMDVLGISPRDLGARLVYDVCHNIAKTENHETSGGRRMVCVHRKGATRSFAPGNSQLCDQYKAAGQPVLIPGDMGTASYVLAGTKTAMKETFGSTCHGAGRVLSRKAAVKAARGRRLREELESRGIFVRATGKLTMAEEMPEAYKDVAEVVRVAHGSGIARKVAKLRPIAVIKG
ncbi:MAG: RtcB family protein [Desulfosalsimonadaceae bacterium]